MRTNGHLRDHLIRTTVAAAAFALTVTAIPAVGTASAQAEEIVADNGAEKLITEVPSENDSQDEYADWFLAVKDWADKNGQAEIKGYADSGFTDVAYSSDRSTYRTKILALLRHQAASEEKTVTNTDTKTTTSPDDNVTAIGRGGRSNEKTVIKRQIISIEASYTGPELAEGTQPDVSDFTVTKTTKTTYSDGTTETSSTAVPATGSVSFTLSGSSKAGKNTWTVSYQGKTAQVAITFKEKADTSSESDASDQASKTAQDSDNDTGTSDKTISDKDTSDSDTSDNTDTTNTGSTDDNDTGNSDSSGKEQEDTSGDSDSESDSARSDASKKTKKKKPKKKTKKNKKASKKKAKKRTKKKSSKKKASKEKHKKNSAKKGKKH